MFGSFRKRHGYVLILGLLCCLTACSAQPGPSQETPLPSVVQPLAEGVTLTPSSLPPTTDEASPAATLTPPPTLAEAYPQKTPSSVISTLFPTATSFPCNPLAPEGPYLVYDTDRDPLNLLIMDIYGGCHRIKLPEGSWVSNLSSFFSPDGRWLAFFTGSFYDAPYDLTLNLMDMTDGTITPISRLLADGYVGNVLLLAEMAYAQEPDNPNCQSADCWLHGVESALLNGIRELAWSPDGRYLAFAGQIDGPSSDLYLLDTQTSEFRRLTDDEYNIHSISWSPDMAWILFENTISGPTSSGSTLHVVAPDTSTVMNPPKLIDETWWWIGQGWLSDNLYLITSNYYDGTGPINLRYVNVETGQVTSLWPDEYFTYAIDRDDLSFALSTWDEITGPSEAGQGLYFIDMNGAWERVSDSQCCGLYFLGSPVYRFLGGTTDGIVGIESNGSMTRLADSSAVSVSPDRRWFILYNPGMGLYSNDGQLVAQFDDMTPLGGYGSGMWLPNSSGLFLESESDIYFMTVPDGEPRLIYHCLHEYCSYSLLAILP